jgi:hypothetical protein
MAKKAKEPSKWQARRKSVLAGKAKPLRAEIEAGLLDALDAYTLTTEFTRRAVLEAAIESFLKKMGHPYQRPPDRPIVPD